jgi:hypothetical protein
VTGSGRETYFIRDKKDKEEKLREEEEGFPSHGDSNNHRDPTSMYPHPSPYLPIP